MGPKSSLRSLQALAACALRPQPSADATGAVVDAGPVDTVTGQTLQQQQRRRLKHSGEQSLRRRLLSVAVEFAAGLRGMVATQLAGGSRRLQQDTLGANGAQPGLGASQAARLLMPRPLQPACLSESPKTWPVQAWWWWAGICPFPLWTLVRACRLPRLRIAH